MQDKSAAENNQPNIGSDVQAFRQFVFDDIPLKNQGAGDHEEADSHTDDGGKPDGDPAEDEEEQGR